MIDTIGIKTGPFSILDWYGTPHSEALHVIERYRLIDGSTAAEAQQKHVGLYMGPSLDPSLLACELISPFYGRAPIDPDTKKKGLQVEITVEDPKSSPLPGRRGSPTGPSKARYPKQYAPRTTAFGARPA